ncbi:MAG TPA: hypothetical protein DDX92_01005 [Flavobacteriales bacterium]|jgi:hypothetical protein|nr:hypothetical protein [Flavobacteriales bacterium]
MKKALVVLAILLFIMVDVHAQCSMCRAVVESDISGKGTGINNAIIYLMVFPYAIIGLMGYFLTRHYLRGRNEQLSS